MLHQRQQFYIYNENAQQYQFLVIEIFFSIFSSVKDKNAVNYVIYMIALR